MTAAYLASLNPQQRRAVEHGGSNLNSAAVPLLVIAGAGSGKTNTLAHRVGHLILNGADPRRILLLTFSRRAAAEMTRRVERIAAKTMGANATTMADALTWSGTFHAVGARLLREYAEQIGLDRSFTIHDREDSADLMNLIRHDHGFSKTEAISDKEHVPSGLFARSEFRNGARSTARLGVPVVRHVARRAAAAVLRLR
jgi:ATP-dependent DNA helicase UvrD/PcrA